MKEPNIAPSTYDRAASQLKAYVQELRPGALAPLIALRDQDGRPLSTADDHLAGRALLILALNTPNAMDELAHTFAAHRDTFDRLNVAVVALSANSSNAANEALRQRSGFVWPVMSDPTGAAFAGLGVHKGSDLPGRAVVLTANRQVRSWFDLTSPLDTSMEALMSELSNAQNDAATYWSTTHAPVLQVPGVFSKEECDQIIRHFETDEPLMIRPPRSGELVGNYKIPVYEHNRQDRIDQIIKDKQTLAFMDERIWGRVVPMIKKAFAFDVTRREDLHVARYVGERSGCVMGHRDNTSAATAYRRFALSINLNDDYDGGEVAFKEYGQQLYKSPPGTALVFSSSLLHEVQETTRGTRYTLISHFFNEHSLANR